jgi:hypothetical protein
MQVTTVRINPSSGDDYATIRLTDNPESPILETVEKGEVLRVMGKENGYYKVAITPKTENVVKGGSGSTGCCLANPYTYLYNNTRKYKSLGRVNNGTALEILEVDDEHPGMFKVKCVTSNGTRIGYMEARYIFRSCIEASPEEG